MAQLRAMVLQVPLRHLLTEAGKDLIEIVVEPYPSPISYQGAYHYRSGSTKQELKGAALDRFLLRKLGRTWDGVPVPHVSLRALSKDVIADFRRLAKQSRRLDTGVLREPDAALIEKLNLLDGAHLKRAAVLLFHPEPERCFVGAYVKIGYFRTESELLYHDEIHGDLFTQVRKTMDVLFTKYLKAVISYQGIYRIETLPVPENALREALLNAIIHRDYSVGAPILIRVYADRLKIWNPGELPDHWSVEKLLQPHSSRPFNPGVANAFFRAGEIEAWGRGIQQIFDACREAKAPEPQVDYHPGDLWFEFPFSPAYLQALHAPSESAGLGEKWGETMLAKRRRIAEAMLRVPRISTPQLASEIGMGTTAIENHLKAMRASGCIKRIGPARGGHWEVMP